MPPSAIHVISDHLFGVLRGSNNLVFGGSRRTVETLADALRSQSERAGVPNEFYPHHGNLSKELREELEKRLKTGDLPTTAVCTTTLELGIDIGSVKSIGQIGAPRSISLVASASGPNWPPRGRPFGTSYLRHRARVRPKKRPAGRTSIQRCARGRGDPTARPPVRRADVVERRTCDRPASPDVVSHRRTRRGEGRRDLQTPRRTRPVRRGYTQGLRRSASARGIPRTFDP